MEQPSLARRLGLRQAVAIGLAAMIGAGVFSVFAPAAQAAGAGLMIGLAIAAFVALANAGSTAQLAARYPESGGAYRYGRERLGEWPGFLAGWGFVVGKTASCAAMAMTFAAYLAPPDWQRPLAVAAVVAIAAVDLRGISRTARVATVIVIGVLGVLALVVAAGATATFDGASGAVSSGSSPFGSTTIDQGWLGILQSAGLLFFAFAGYARIATLGEEVREPARTIPRAIGIAFAVAVLVYAGVGAAALGALGPTGLAASVAPLVDVVEAAGWQWAAPVVRVGAAVAALGALLALLAGIGRTALAMARDEELPPPLARVHPRFRVPHVAEIAVALVVIALVATVDLRGAIGFSSFGVLVYYLVANLAAITQPRSERRFPQALSAAGAVGCLVLVATLPPVSIVAGVVVFAIGAAYRLISRAARPSG
ncbi:APA family basic amino acid/polyamine antiporter [Agromyces hippuratus]|uniref:APA family basic amino acid/polyamine antiporter n=1 Tax=Agromyces hippuratus TaxID=286438 RepID=A0A852WSB2_9MICO|nr:APC family permease [Agromyces hippuratus]NYG20806.1 APA family basic amino acid/polyamine antiporter [Agromyces hippuratus]